MGIRRLGRGFGLAQSTAYRYLDEVIEARTLIAGGQPVDHSHVWLADKADVQAMAHR